MRDVPTHGWWHKRLRQMEGQAGNLYPLASRLCSANGSVRCCQAVKWIPFAQNEYVERPSAVDKATLSLATPSGDNHE